VAHPGAAASGFCLDEYTREGIMMYNKPLAYFITFTTYGTWLHGDPRKSVVVKDHLSTLLAPNDLFLQYEQAHLKYPAAILDNTMRRLVLDAVIERCCYMQWRLLACHVRSNHVHVLICAETPIGQVLSSLKAWATRQLRQSGYDLPAVWTRHGSTKYIFRKAKLLEKAHYILYEQGEMMAYYLDPELVINKSVERE
jgi:REP element-mobilizing transposase RayT